MSQSENIERLSEFKHARLRTEMYLGSREPNQQTVLSYQDGVPVTREYVWTPALFTAYREIFDNAVDEVVSHGHGDRIDIAFDPVTLTVSVSDNGRGIPIGIDESTGRHMATIALCETRAGRNFNDDTRGTTRGLNGVGASIVNMTAKNFTVTIHRDGQKFVQRFEEGEEHVAHKPKITPYTGPKRGTHIEFTPAPEVFRNMLLPEDFIRDRVFEASLCYPDLKLYLNGKAVKSKGVGKGLFSKHKTIDMTIQRGNFKSDFWLVPQFFEDGEVAHSLVNAIPVFNGGAHIDAFRRNFYGGLLKALEKESKKRKLQPNRADISDGMLIFNITEMDGAQFDSQSKTRMINDDVGNVIKAELNDGEFYKRIIRKHSDWIDDIYRKCSERTMKNDAADLKKLIKSSAKVRVEKLRDANSKDRSQCRLLITEGDCLLGTTDIIVLNEEGDFCDRSMNEIEIGDMVLTHTGEFQPVTGKTEKISPSLHFTTQHGEIVTSPEHRMAVHNRDTNEFEWLLAKDIVPGIHRFVRNRVVDATVYGDITHACEIPDEKFTRYVEYSDSSGAKVCEMSTPDHQYGVFDISGLTMEKVKSINIDPSRHKLLFK